MRSWCLASAVHSPCMRACAPNRGGLGGICERQRMLRRSARIGTDCRTAALIARARGGRVRSPRSTTVQGRLGLTESTFRARGVERDEPLYAAPRRRPWRVAAVDSAALRANTLPRLPEESQPCPRGVVTFSSRHAAMKRRSSAGRWTASQRSRSRPASWIVVDDGSTDETPHILAEYARTAAVPQGRPPRRPRATQRRAGRGGGLLRRAGGRGPRTVRLPLQARHGPRSAAPVLRGADAADGGRAAAGHDLGEAVVHPPAHRARWCPRCAATRCRWG